MAIAAYQNTNVFPMSISGLSNELSIVIPTLKYVAGNYDAYVGLIPGFVLAADDYLTLPSEDVVYIELPWVPQGPIPSYTTNADALSNGVPPGGFYCTDSAGERIVKVAYTPEPE